jgi:hypothetical protein
MSANVKRIYHLKDGDEYPWVVHMKEIPSDFSVDWLEERAIHCSMIGRIFFFKREEDRLMFLMKWATNNDN